MGMRHCPRCDLDLDAAAFDFRDAGRTRYQSYCRDCAKSAWRAWYAKDENRQRHIQAVSKRRQRRQAELRDLVRAVKSVPCADCGGSFPPEAMDFDHLDSKEGLVSQMVFSVGRELLSEIAKCEVVCANCHRIRTVARRLGNAQERPCQ